MNGDDSLKETSERQYEDKLASNQWGITNKPHDLQQLLSQALNSLRKQLESIPFAQMILQTTTYGTYFNVTSDSVDLDDSDVSLLATSYLMYMIGKYVVLVFKRCFTCCFLRRRRQELSVWLYKEPDGRENNGNGVTFCSIPETLFDIAACLLLQWNQIYIPVNCIRNINIYNIGKWIIPLVTITSPKFPLRWLNLTSRKL